MRSPILFALPVMVASILAVPFYMRFVRAGQLSVMRAIALPVVVIAVVTAIFVATIILTVRVRP